MVVGLTAVMWWAVVVQRGCKGWPNACASWSATQSSCTEQCFRGWCMLLVELPLHSAGVQSCRVCLYTGCAACGHRIL